MELSGSVGRWDRGAVNRKEDVMAVQKALAVASDVCSKPEYDPGTPDGAVARPPKSSKTVDAICAFQRSFMPAPDGVIDPRGGTLQRLGKYSKGPSAAVPLATPHVANLSFPLAFIPNLSFRTAGRRFGALRENGTRKHAGCDLIAPEGTPIYAIADGVVTREMTYFYRGTYSLEVTHGKLVARYCEIKGVAKGITRGSKVKRGEVIAYVGKMYVDSMLHFEMYLGVASGPLTQRNNPPYQRRSDLLDPTAYLTDASKRLPK